MPPGPRSALSHALCSSGVETAALATLAAQSPTRSEHPLTAIARCAPIADVAFAILRKYFVPGSSPYSARPLHLLGRLTFAPHGQVELFDPVAELQATLSTCQHQGVTVDWNRAYRLLVSPSPRLVTCGSGFPPTGGRFPGRPSLAPTPAPSWPATRLARFPPAPWSPLWLSSPTSPGPRTSTRAPLSPRAKRWGVRLPRSPSGWSPPAPASPPPPAPPPRSGCAPLGFKPGARPPDVQTSRFLTAAWCATTAPASRPRR